MSLSYLLRSQVASFVLFLIFVAGAPSLLAATPMIAAGWSHTIALKSDGTVVAWGDNGDGQLGNGTTTASVTPAVVGGLSNVVAVAAGRYHSAALKSDGTVMTWGANTNGQLGNGSTTRSTTPQAVPDLTGVIAVAAGNSHTVALKSDGTLMAWGDNTNGQLGDGAALSAPSTSAPTTTTTTTTTSTKPGSLPPTYTPAIVKQPVVEPIARNPKPVAVVGLSEVVAIAAGGAHTVALKSDGTVRAWGNNNSGELGNGTTTDSSRPNVVPGLTGVVALAASSVGYYTVALKSDGILSKTIHDLDLTIV